VAGAGEGRVPGVQPAGGAGAGGAAAGEPMAPGGAGQARPRFTLHRRPLLTHGAEQGASIFPLINTQILVFSDYDISERSMRTIQPAKLSW
jgi:hypothetical protein